MWRWISHIHGAHCEAEVSDERRRMKELMPSTTPVPMPHIRLERKHGFLRTSHIDDHGLRTATGRDTAYQRKAAGTRQPHDQGACRRKSRFEPHSSATYARAATEARTAVMQAAEAAEAAEVEQKAKTWRCGSWRTKSWITRACWHINERHMIRSELCCEQPRLPSNKTPQA